MEKTTVALVAHDHKKQELIEWLKLHSRQLKTHPLVCTGTTGKLVEKALDDIEDDHAGVTCLMSGPLGGDQQLGAMIAEGKVKSLFFFWDPMEPHPHDVDVKALLRIAVVYNIPFACNRSSADFLISSPLFNSAYQIKENDYSTYTQRKVE